MQRALIRAHRDIERLVDRLEQSADPNAADVLRVQLLILDDPELLGAVRKATESQVESPAAAYQREAERYAAALEALEDPYLRARAPDVRDVAGRVRAALRGESEEGSPTWDGTAVLVARELTPSETAQLDRRRAAAICTAEGGALSHSAILARALGIPAVVAIGPALLEVNAGTLLAVDGDAGEVWVDPPPKVAAAFQQLQKEQHGRGAAAREVARAPAFTRDGHGISVMANLGSTADIQFALAAGAEGVGLLRTEFLYLESTEAPDEDKQAEAYRQVVDAFAPRPVVLRTLDVGGDKTLAWLPPTSEANPALGLRGLRLCLRYPALFRTQLRAALRAASAGALKIMLPMVSGLEEVQAARAHVEACRESLRAEGYSVPERVEVGIMVETPAAALVADSLAAEVDFFSIGTNDLTQYTLAVDRANAAVADLGRAYHPAVLRLIAQVVGAAHAHGRPVAVCGELAGESLAVPLLVGLGVDELSMNPRAIPEAKRAIRGVSYAAAQAQAEAALQSATPEAVLRLLRGSASDERPPRAGQ